jgi:hypothetical protein
VIFTTGAFSRVSREKAPCVKASVIGGRGARQWALSGWI